MKIIELKNSNLEELVLISPLDNIYDLKVLIGERKLSEEEIAKEEVDVLYIYQVFTFPYRPNIIEIKNTIIKAYNMACDKEIVSGMTYEDNMVWLSPENQFNYKSAFDFASQTKSVNLPVTFKFGSELDPVYKTFSTLTELKEFIRQMLAHIDTTLNKYWTIKNNIDWTAYEE